MGLDSLRVLNRLVGIHERSLPTYLSYASPAWHRGDQKAKETLDHIAEDQREMADRLCEYIDSQGAAVDHGAYPMVFTGYHDLSFDWLLTRLIELQAQDLQVIQRCTTEVQSDPEALALVEEAVGAAKGHMQSLEELRESASAA